MRLCTPSFASTQTASAPDGFERAVLPHRQSLLRAAARLSGSSGDADDLVQETVLRAWQFWPRYRSQGNVRAWLHRILFNTFVSRYRQERRERRLLQELGSMNAQTRDAGAASAGQPSEVLFDDELKRGLDELPPASRRVLLLVDVGDWSYREVSRELDCPMGTVMSRLHRARRALAQSLRAQAA